MKKDFLDHLYELRSAVKTEIDKLVISSKQPQAQCCENMVTKKADRALDAKRNHIYTINQTIQFYLDTHK